MSLSLSADSERRLTAVTGGIGSGKSVVCKILRTLGYPVYDCDIMARQLMANDLTTRMALLESFPDAHIDGILDRQLLSRIVFADADRLQALNAAVHGAVRRDLAQWCGTRSGRLFVETAILYESQLDLMVDDVWSVEAPDDVRLKRVMLRNGLAAEEVQARIDAQQRYIPDRRHPSVHTIVNDGVKPLLPQIFNLL